MYNPPGVDGTGEGVGWNWACWRVDDRVGRNELVEGKSIVDVSETEIEDRLRALLDVVLVAEGGGNGGASFLCPRIVKW